ncbi:acyltransferase domain-containing protein [Hirsutella rhossiliensis]|uniref:Tafazzin family protein n=1 Tax=Hirsutella rhossiliensis TaxID=111463 RepID=A0A9P8MRH4_9HYPO|nr:acyltransferase domain-containing protein [Hirsutella rhossiliensis]KAH0960533.1 acyltransferase domain-containing protein [Hirsutella rhossiliensis]
MSTPAPAAHPGLPWRLASMAVMGTVGTLSRCFLYGFNHVEVTGLNHLLGALDRRRTWGPERGLLTVCNHVGVLDDPLMWGILPLRYTTDLANLRWGLGAHDICFKNRFSSTFFSLGQVLPTRRLWHSPLGGLYQPTMAQAISILSGPAKGSTLPGRFFSTDGSDSFPAPAAYTARRHAWVHVFPEACCHQSPDSSLRYFKWGISRLILESDPAPVFIPMFIHGTQAIMPEDRGWPRWLPRVGNRVEVVIGEPKHVDSLFGRQRAAWKRLADNGNAELLEHDQEAVRLRIEVAKSVRDEVQKLRDSIGLPREEDETAALAETWSKEPNKRRFKSPVDGSLVTRH